MTVSRSASGINEQERGALQLLAGPLEEPAARLVDVGDLAARQEAADRHRGVFGNGPVPRFTLPQCREIANPLNAFRQHLGHLLEQREVRLRERIRLGAVDGKGAV